jgi:hypothetical protein
MSHLSENITNDVESQERVLVTGGTVLALSQGPLLIGYNVLGDTTGISLVVGALMAISGLFILTSADIDLNLYLKRNWKTCVAFSLGFLFLFAITILLLTVFFIIPAVPIACHILPYRTWNMPEGHIRYSESGALVLTLFCFAMAVLYFQQSFQAIGILAGYSSVVPAWTPLVLSGSWALGFLMCIAAYYWSKARGENLTQQWWTLLYVFLLTSGVAQILYTWLKADYGMHPEDGDMYPPATTVEWLQGPLQIIPTVIAMLFRKSMYGYLGQRWAKQRMEDG